MVEQLRLDCRKKQENNEARMGLIKEGKKIIGIDGMEQDTN